MYSCVCFSIYFSLELFSGQWDAIGLTRVMYKINIHNHISTKDF